jgi:hypothetical protein
MDSDIERKIIYFQYCGEVNTDKVLHAAKIRCEESGINKVIIASETGRSALKALNIFSGTKIKLIVVTHYPAKTWGPKGDILIGLKRKEYAETLKRLEENGVKIVQGTLPLAPPSRWINWDFPTPESIIDKTLEIFGAGVKIAIEAAIMATDAGEVDPEAEVVFMRRNIQGFRHSPCCKNSLQHELLQGFRGQRDNSQANLPRKDTFTK